MKIQLIAKREEGISGISRYSASLQNSLVAAGLDAEMTFPDPIEPGTALGTGLRRLGIDLRAFFNNYPLHARLQPASIYHLTGQTLATLLLFQRFPGPVVVTVHDIIPYMMRNDPEFNTFRHPVEAFFFWLSMQGLKRADALVAVSEYTKKTLVDFLKIAPEKIHVVPEAVDAQKFHPAQVPDAFYEKYRLDQGQKHILFVGSDDPRKNLAVLIRAFAAVKSQYPGVKLLKVGSGNFPGQRKRLLELIDGLGLRQDVLFFEAVPDEDLVYFYNLAVVFVLPSFYEGFGLPALEAMACGRPVIVSGSSSLPEIVGETGIIIDPDDVKGLASQINRILEDNSFATLIGRAALDRSVCFRDFRISGQIFSVYTSAQKI